MRKYPKADVAVLEHGCSGTSICILTDMSLFQRIVFPTGQSR